VYLHVGNSSSIQGERGRERVYDLTMYGLVGKEKKMVMDMDMNIQ